MKDKIDYSDNLFDDENDFNMETKNTKIAEKEKEIKRYERAISHPFAVREFIPHVGNTHHGFESAHKMIEFIEKTRWKNHEIHEMICNNSDNKRHLLYFDFDGKSEIFKNNNIAMEDFIDLFHGNMIEVFNSQGIYNPDYKTLTCDRDGKYSTHLIYNVSVVSSHAKCIPLYIERKMEQCLERLGSDPELAKCIDTAVYNSICSLRIMGSPKYENGNDVGRLVIKDEDEPFDYKTLVNVISEDTKEFHCLAPYCSKIGENADKAIENITNHHSQEYIKKVCDYIEKHHPNLRVKKVVGDSLIQTTNDRTLPCGICCRIHDNDNQYFTIHANGTVIMRCHRDKTNWKVEMKSDDNIVKVHVNPKAKLAKIIMIQQLIRTCQAGLKRLLKNPHMSSADKYLQSLVDIMAHQKHVAVASPMGTGKTKALFEYLRSLDATASIVSIVHRRSLTADMRPKYLALGFEIYDELKGEILLKDHPRILIQYESVGRINMRDQKLDLLVCDEINSICMQYLSKLTREARYNGHRLEALFRNAERSILLDGMLDDKIITAVNALGKRNYFILQNTPLELYSPIVRIAAKRATFDMEIITKLRDGKKVEIVTSSGPKYCEEMCAFIKGALPNIKILQIHSESDDYDNAIGDVENYWPMFDCVIRSPSVGAGVDFNAEHFDYSFVYITSLGPLANDILQAMRRSRNIRTKTYYMHFGNCRTYILPRTFSDVIEYAEQSISHKTKNAILDEFEGRDDNGDFKFRNLDNPLLQFDINCRVYHNSQRRNVMKKVIQGLCRIGAKFEFIEELNAVESKNVDSALSTISEKLKSVKFKEIASAEELTKEEFSEICKRPRMTGGERAKFNKYIIRARYRYNGEMNEEWVKKYTDKNALLMNKYLRYRDDPIEALGIFSENELRGMTDEERLDGKKTPYMYKVAYVRIRKIFDLYNKTEEFPVKMMEYINSQIDRKNELFGTNKVDKPSARYILPVVNNILIALGYKIKIKRVTKNIDRNNRIYEFELEDDTLNYYNPKDHNGLDPLKPNFP